MNPAGIFCSKDNIPVLLRVKLKELKHFGLDELSFGSYGYAAEGEELFLLVLVDVSSILNLDFLLCHLDLFHDRPLLRTSSNSSRIPKSSETYAPFGTPRNSKHRLV